MNLQKSFGTMLLGGALAISSQLLAIKPANAALLAQYDLNGNRNNSAPSDPNFGVTQLSSGAGLAAGSQYSGITRTGTGKSLAIRFSDVVTGTKANSIATNSYYSFTLTPNSTPSNLIGTKLDTFFFRTDVGNASSTTVGNFFVQANLGTGGAFIDLGPTFTQTATTTRPASNLPQPSFVDRTINLSGFTSANNSGYFTRPIEFRIYEYDNNANTTGGGLRIDDVRLNGEVAPVPELSTGLLVALSMGGLCFVGMRRKKGAAPSMNMAF